uniref:Uncharacterized protein n=1 Tax=Schizaphis graminum TaxID=13262 RepID=A0A2S2NT78_SCHGA
MRAAARTRRICKIIIVENGFSRVSISRMSGDVISVFSARMRNFVHIIIYDLAIYYCVYNAYITIYNVHRRLLWRRCKRFSSRRFHYAIRIYKLETESKTFFFGKYLDRIHGPRNLYAIY